VRRVLTPRGHRPTPLAIRVPLRFTRTATALELPVPASTTTRAGGLGEQRSSCRLRVAPAFPSTANGLPPSPACSTLPVPAADPPALAYCHNVFDPRKQPVISTRDERPTLAAYSPTLQSAPCTSHLIDPARQITTSYRSRSGPVPTQGVYRRGTRPPPTPCPRQQRPILHRESAVRWTDRSPEAYRP